LFGHEEFLGRLVGLAMRKRFWTWVRLISADTCSEMRAASLSRKSPSLKAQPSDRKPEENPPAKKTDKEEKKRLCLNLGKKTEP
jgi:hypothetical protein